MTTQSEFLQKAVQTTDSIAQSGKLNPKQADRFLDFVFDESVLKGNVRMERFRNEQFDIDTMGVGKRVALSHKEAQDPQRRRSAKFSQRKMIPAEVVVPLEFSERFLAHNLEGMSAEDHVLSMMARAFSNDLEELYILGNPLGRAATPEELDFGTSTTTYVKDEYLALQTGWSELAEAGNILDANGANISPNLFSQGMQALPTKFQRQLNSMRWLLPQNLDHKYNEKVSARATAAGDSALAGGSGDSFGIRRVPVPLWPLEPQVVEHVTLSGTTAVALKNKNIKSVIVLPEDLDDTALTPFINTTDYIVDAAAGTIARTGGGAIGDGDVVKVTYQAGAQMLLTDLRNLIVGVSMNITILQAPDIYKNTRQWAMHARVGVQIEEPDAIVKVKNIGLG